MRPWMAVLAVMVACNDSAGDSAEWTCEVPDDLSSGEVQADIDGAAWSADSLTYLWAGSSLQFTMDATDGWRLSAVAQTTADGTAMADVVDSLPIEIAMESGQEGGFAVLYPDDGESLQTVAGGGGVLVIDSDADGDFLGCLRFDAQSDSGSVGFDGAFRARLSDL